MSNKLKIQDIYPLSPMQSGFLFYNIYKPASDDYFLQTILQLEGDVNFSHLQKAWQYVVNHHSILRTGFIWQDGDVPLQYVQETIDVPFAFEDWRNVGNEEEEKKLSSFLTDDRRNIFDLRKAPLFRLTLIRCAENRYYLIWSQHHILMDGWSTPIILQDVFHTYEALRQNKKIQLSPRRAYRDYIAWLQNQDLIKAETFWKDYLASIENPTSLSFKHLLPDHHDNDKDYDTYLTNFSLEETQDLKAFAQDKGLTLNTILQAAVGLVLKTYTQQNEVVLGVTVSGRSMDLPQAEEMVGLFINTLPLKISSHAAQDSLSFLKDLQDQTQKLNEYAYTPLAQIQSWTGRNKGLFDVIFVFENYPIDEAAHNVLKDFTIKDVKAIERTEYPLTITIVPDKELIIDLKYQTEHFNEDILKRFTDHIKQTIKGIIQNIDRNPLELSLLTSSERHQLLVEWNNTKADYPQDKTIHQLFEGQVKRTPDSIALVYEDQELTYRELNERANQLAHHLRSLGVQPDTLVALAVERSLEMVIGLLAILKAGGAYVPLDSTYPEERLKFMLEDTKAPILITQQELNEKFKEYDGTLLNIGLRSEEKVLYIEECTQNTQSPQTKKEVLIPSNFSEDPEPLSTPQHLAYVIYTSGSTGNPKGVMVHGNSLINFLYSLQRNTEIDSSDKFLSLTSLSFDISNLELMLPLIVGARIVRLNKRDLHDINQIQNILTLQDVTAIQATPSFLSDFTNKKWMHKRKVKILCGGEKPNQNTVSYFCADKTSFEFWNLYGPTETTIWSIVYKIEDYNALTGDSVPIGRPISNTQIYLLDEELNVVPIGVSGEIYIGGAGLARGYLNRPDLTADRFIPNPFVEGEDIHAENLRLYRTGDLARYLADGNIEFMGRIDDQVKIRGYRIELGEIESSLHKHGDVLQAIVVARDDSETSVDSEQTNHDNHKKLVAYIVLSETLREDLSVETELTSSAGKSFSVLKGDDLPVITEDLRNPLSRFLPDHMIPAYFVYLDEVPLTPNGKTDRKALPAPNLSLRLVTDQFVEPRTPLEEDLGSIWKEVLNIPNIGINDNFFKLGGHSLLATQVISRIRHSFSIDIPLRALFDLPTIAELSLEIESLINQNNLSSLPALTPITRDETLPLSFAQHRLWFLDQLLPETALYNIPIALKLIGDLNNAALEHALNFLIERHESLRTIFPSANGQAHQNIVSLWEINLSEHTVDLTNLDDEEKIKVAQDIAQKEATTPFQLSSMAPIRIKLVSLKEKENLLLITLHHIISDGWSMEIFFKELAHLYNAFATNKKPELTPLPIQYADFAVWQRDWLKGEVLEKQLAYWKEQLKNIPDLLSLPSDKPRPRELTYKGGTYQTSLSREVKEKLTQLVQEHGASLFMVLLAAFQVLLYRYTGQKDIVVGTPIANRHHKEIEGLIGFFVNTLALRTTFEGEETFLDVLNKVKETTLQAYQHQDVPFEQLVDHLNISRTLNRNPVFQTIFSFQNSSQEDSFFLQGIKTESFDRSYPIAKFDLSLYVEETSDLLRVGFEYTTDLFKAETIERMGSHFKELLEGIVKNPSENMNFLPLLTSSERHQLLVEWNDTKADYPQDKTIHQLFEDQVKKTPDSIALVYEDQELTYRELNERANQLAHHLRSLGVQPDTLVALAIERSLEMVIGLLAILKAGGAYVPLDPTYPEERLNFILNETNVPIIITDESSIDLIPSSFARIITLNEDWGDIAMHSAKDPEPLSTPHHLAYVIYTSGSTGNPKGVMVQHKSLSHYVQYAHTTYPINLDPTPFYSSPIFDMSITTLFLPLINGNAILILPDDAHGESLANLLHSECNLSFIKLTPSHLKVLETQLNWNLLSKRDTTLIIGGENLLKDDLRSWMKALPNTCVFNEYGPTEATVGSIVYKIEDYNALTGDSVPIGRPISNTQIYLLDEELNVVPIGVSGEIYIGGVGLARGYLNRPDLTADRFIPNPFVEGEDIHAENLRLYRTGDLARYLADGNIEFMGRIDDQVKIRGYRIELGEIESSLHKHGDVLQAIVVARDDSETSVDSEQTNHDNHKKLVAYIVLSETLREDLSVETELTSSAGKSFSVLKGDDLPVITEDLRNPLSRFLPDHMIPAYFVYLDEVPLTPNGKTDRKALPAPNLSLRLVTDQFVEPRTPLEEDLVSIWKEVLNIPNIGINDNFFRIGGDSIISIQMVAKARVKGISFAVKDVFNHPTIASLSSVANIIKDAPNLLPVQNTISGEVPLTPIQHWFFELNLFNKSHFNQSLLLGAQKDLDVKALNHIFSFILSHHDALRLRYHKSKDGQWIQTSVAQEESFSIEEIDLSHVSSETDLIQNIEEKSSLVQESLNIEKGPLIRVVLFNYGENKLQRLLIVIHHLVIDGVSWRILLDDLETLYSQWKRQEELCLPSKTHSYQQWSESLVEYASSQSLEEEVPYWQNIVQQMSPPFFDPEGQEQKQQQEQEREGKIQTITESLSCEETSLLLKRVPKAYRTEINDILLTALVLAIGDWTQTYALTLSLEGHGREDIIPDMDLSRTIGWFTSIFPVHLSLTNPQDLADSIKTVKEELRKVPHKGIGYGILKYLSSHNLLETETNLREPTISFNYLGQWDNSLSPDKLFSLANESTGEHSSKQNKHSQQLSINAEVINNALQISWTYSTTLYKHSTIETVAQIFTNKLRQLIDHCSTDSNFGYTPSDFELEETDYTALEKRLSFIPGEA